MITSEKIYPWQKTQWQQLMASQAEKKLPHALLLTGIPGLGKKTFAMTFAHALLCGASNGPCETCRSCALIKANTHPDLLIIEPEETGRMIKIDQIRAMIPFVNETALCATMRVVMISPADAMNLNAANALLKTLEEPAPNTMIILVGNANLKLPATILSRCQRIFFAKPGKELALNWLKAQLPNHAIDFNVVLALAAGAPLCAKKWVEEGVFELRQRLSRSLHLLSQAETHPLALASEYQGEDIRTILYFILIWLQDLLRFQLTQGQTELINSDYQTTLAKLATVWSPAKVVQYYQEIQMQYAHLRDALNLNKQLLLENIWIRWEQYAAS